MTRTMKHSRPAIVLLLWCGLSAVTTVGAEPVVIDRIVAVVDNDIISSTELSEQMRTVRAQLRQQRITPPPDRTLRRQVLEQLVMEQIQLQLAEEVGILVDDEALNQAISGIAAQNNLSLDEFRRVLESEGFDFASFREDIRREMILHRLRQQHVDNRISVTEQEVDNFLATQRRQGRSSDEYHLGHILIALPDAASPEQIQQTREQARELHSKLEAGADFSETAIAASDGQQALNGGDLGWRKAGELPTLFAEIVPQMTVGTVSDLIRSSSGFHIVKLLDHRPGERRFQTQTRARHILIETSELVSDPQARETLRELRARLAAGEDFAGLAVSYSDDGATAAAGGDLGWAGPGETLPAFEEAMDDLEIGEISEPVQSRLGWHLIEVTDRRERDVTEEATRESAREVIFRRKSEEEHTDWLRRLREDAYVEVRL